MKNRVRQLRNECNLSLRELAQKTNLDYSGINEFENQKRSLPIRKIIILADFFKISLDYLLYRTDIPKMAHEYLLPKPLPPEYRNQTEKDILMELKRIDNESTLKQIKGVIEILSEQKEGETKTVIDTQNQIGKEGQYTQN